MAMTTAQKLAFVHKMTRTGLDAIPHFDNGGMVNATSTNTPATQLAGPGAAATSGQAAAPGSGITGEIGGFLGLNNNYQAGSANIQQGTNAAQLNQGYQGAQAGLANQGNLVAQTQPGVAQGLGAQAGLVNQLQAEAAGQGPSPAQAALNQSTGQNIAEQAALAAGTRGAAANAGGIAAANAQQGAATEQQAVGQAATLGAQQQIAAQQQLQQLAGTQVGQGAAAVGAQNQAQQNEQGILQGANTAANTAAVQQQSNINATNAQTAAANQQAHGNILGGVLSGVSSAISSIFAEGGEVVSPMHAGGMAHGAPAMKKMAMGGYMAPTPLIVGPPSATPQSFVGNYLNSGSGGGGGANVQMPTGGSNISGEGITAGANALGTSIGNAVSPEEEEGPKQDNQAVNEAISLQGENPGNIQPANNVDFNPGVQMSAKGGKIKKQLPMMYGKNDRLMKAGGKVKAETKNEKAVSNKDSYSNDKVPALLSEGEVVMDKDTLNDPGQIGQMARTVAHHIATRNAMKKGARRV